MQHSNSYYQPNKMSLNDKSHNQYSNSLNENFPTTNPNNVNQERKLSKPRNYIGNVGNQVMNSTSQNMLKAQEDDLQSKLNMYKDKLSLIKEDPQATDFQSSVNVRQNLDGRYNNSYQNQLSSQNSTNQVQSNQPRLMVSESEPVFKQNIGQMHSNKNEIYSQENVFNQNASKSPPSREYNKDFIIYDQHDDDVNRLANKQLNNMSHFNKNGSLDINDFEREEKLRKYHQNIVMQKALLDQMEEKKRMREDSKKQRLQEEAETKLRWRQNFERGQENSQINHSKNFAREDSTVYDENYEEVKKLEREKMIHSQLKSEQEEMEKERERMRYQLQEELKKERLFMTQLPDLVNSKIRETMRKEISKIKNSMNENTDKLRNEVQTLRGQAIQLDKEKQESIHQISKLRNNLSKIHAEDEIRNYELMHALADDHTNKILPTSSYYSPEMQLGYNTENDKQGLYENYYNNKEILGLRKNNFYVDEIYQKYDIESGFGTKKIDEEDFKRPYNYSKSKYDDNLNTNYFYDGSDQYNNDQTDIFNIGIKNDERLNVFSKILRDGNDSNDTQQKFIDRDISKSAYF